MNKLKIELEKLYQDCYTIEEFRFRSLLYFGEVPRLTAEELESIHEWLKTDVYDRLSLKNAVEHDFYKEKSTCNTFYATIHCAGDYDTAIQVAREYTFGTGACFQITACDYVYTGGKESGVTARVICYPRFPKSNEQILKETTEFAFILAEKLCQKSFTIESSTDTMYFESNKPLHGK